MENNKSIKAWNFVGNFKIFATISILVVLAGLIMNIIFGTRLDINFKGGARITYSYTGEVDLNAARDAIQNATGQDATVTQSTDMTDQSTNLVVTLPGDKSLSTDMMGDITSALQERFQDNEIAMLESDSVDPSVGIAFFGKSLFAVGLAAILVVVYVGFRFRKIGGVSAGVMALIALLHDLVVIYFVYVIFRIPLNDNFIAVMLTILGYSLNDTIVIYDRIRENRRLLGMKMPFRQLVNVSITQSFRRSLVTSITTFIAITTVFVVAVVRGLDSIISFALPMMFGVASGAYSSICIAGPLWVFWKEHREKKLEAESQKKKTTKTRAKK